jgi:uncharacterized protein YchJ
MRSRYVAFVKDWALKHNMSYMCAATKPALKTAYRKKYPSNQTAKGKQGMERFYNMMKNDKDDASSRLTQRRPKRRPKRASPGTRSKKRQ